MNISKITSDSISKYFNTLTNVGYKNIKELTNLILLIVIEEILDNEHLNYFVTEEDYKCMQNILTDLYGTSLISYPDFELQKIRTEDILNNYSIYVTKDNLKISEDNHVRLVN